MKYADTSGFVPCKRDPFASEIADLNTGSDTTARPKPHFRSDKIKLEEASCLLIGELAPLPRASETGAMPLQLPKPMATSQLREPAWSPPITIVGDGPCQWNQYKVIDLCRDLRLALCSASED
jgi:hypothetical protein